MQQMQRKASSDCKRQMEDRNFWERGSPGSLLHLKSEHLIDLMEKKKNKLRMGTLKTTQVKSKYKNKVITNSRKNK